MKALSIKNLQKTYKNNIHALQDVDLDVEEGDFFALLGPNGAGKSTLIGIVTSLVTKTAGKVSIFDYDIETDFSAAKACIGVVPQEFNFSIFDKVIHIMMTQAGYYGLPRQIAYARAEKYLKKLNLWDRRKQSVRSLSGGLKRRLMIARALVHEPKLLILDEPTTGIDIELRRATWDFLQELNQKGTTIILTTHYLEEAEYLCKNVAIIHQGRIIENTNVKSLISTLDVETFVFDLTAPLNLDFSVNGFKTYMSDSHTLEVDVPKARSLNDVFRVLLEKNIAVKSMRNKVNRLEELFVRLINK
ncbi:MAG: ABC transporter [Gammaproteobacteria bacterium RIFCSPHIGHO2_02_FULL_42_13]|nr:MAG: ABC transporter [Gammaproteobacteria bacterium RIFCSPHIGHO2_02_FULL_42_13]